MAIALTGNAAVDSLLRRADFCDREADAAEERRSSNLAAAKSEGEAAAENRKLAADYRAAIAILTAVQAEAA